MNYVRKERVAVARAFPPSSAVVKGYHFEGSNEVPFRDSLCGEKLQGPQYGRPMNKMLITFKLFLREPFRTQHH